MTVMSEPAARAVRLASTQLGAPLDAMRVSQALRMMTTNQRHHVYRARLGLLRRKATLGRVSRAQPASTRVLRQLSAWTARRAHLMATHRLPRHV